MQHKLYKAVSQKSGTSWCISSSSHGCHQTHNTECLSSQFEKRCTVSGVSGRSQQQEQEVALGHTAVIVRKQKEINAGSQLTVLSLVTLGLY